MQFQTQQACQTLVHKPRTSHQVPRRVRFDMIQSKPTDNIARPNVYKCPITLSQRISADCPKTTNDIASAEM